MNRNTWLHAATKHLDGRDIPTARLDALVLLEDVLRVDRSKILAEPELEIPDRDLKRLDELVRARAKHVPLAYVRGQTEFYGRRFVVDKHVLVPRPESETMIDLLQKLALPPKPSLLDVGTGSGALGITAALELNGSELTLLDISPEALDIAGPNVAEYGLSARLLTNDLLANLAGHFDAMLCNLPYVPEDHPVNKAAGHEPKLALFGGRDGLSLYRTLFSQLAGRIDKPSFVLTEALPEQHTALLQIAMLGGYQLRHSRDFIQVFAPKA